MKMKKYRTNLYIRADKYINMKTDGRFGTLKNHNRKYERKSK